MAQPGFDLVGRVLPGVGGDELDALARAALPVLGVVEQPLERVGDRASGSSGASSSGPSEPKIDSALTPASSTHGSPQASISLGISEKLVSDRHSPTVASEYSVASWAG